MVESELVEHLILGWKGVFSGLRGLTCLDATRETLGFLDLSISLPAALLPHHQHGNPADKLSFLVRASLLISIQADIEIFVLNFMLSELVEGPLAACCKVACGLLINSCSVLSPHYFRNEVVAKGGRVSHYY